MKTLVFHFSIGVLLFCAMPSVRAEDRIALVIGNNQYPADGLFPTLKNCVADATLVADTSDKMGFHVLRVFNATRSQMDDKRAEFESALRPGCTAVFYFAGHGIEYEKTDYLMAANAKLKARSLLGEESMNAETFAQAMVGGGARSSFLFLDCCRESPPAEWVTRGVRKRGLAKLDIQGDLIVAYAATPGQAALDGDETAKNSPYATALAHWLPMGLAHPQMFQEVRREVFQATKGEQRTYEEGSFLVDYVFPKLGVPAMSTTPVKPVDKSFPPARNAVAAATKDAPFVNSLGQEFVPVSGTKALFCRWDTRVKDYRKFVRATNRSMSGQMFVMRIKAVNLAWWVGDRTANWENPGFEQSDEHPVVGVSLEDSRSFCEWLTEREQRSGLLPSGATYRLPTDVEWSAAAGPGKYPWGNSWPPHEKVGNYADASFARQLPGKGWKVFPGLDDGWARTSPVGTYAANLYGLYDMGGNVWQWCESRFKAAMNSELRKTLPGSDSELAPDGTPLWVLRGGSWCDAGPYGVESSSRGVGVPANRTDEFGFRCVLSPSND
jgi:formylglycine-generating enzyme required for sulfatase activity